MAQTASTSKRVEYPTDVLAQAEGNTGAVEVCGDPVSPLRHQDIPGVRNVVQDSPERPTMAALLGLEPRLLFTPLFKCLFLCN